MGIFEHFPYTNFHNLNLDKILERTHEAEAAAAASAEDAAQAAADAAQAAVDATQALNTATQALNTANAANTAAGNAVSTANAANTAADNAVSTANAANIAAGNAVNAANSALAAIPTIIPINCSGTSAVMDTELTYDEVATLAANNKVVFRVNDSGNLAPSPIIWPLLWEYSGQNRILVTYIKSDMLGAGKPGNLYVRECYFTNSLTGTYKVGYTTLTAWPQNG